jgi:hypothetical protein
MFWKKKQVTAAPVIEGATATKEAEAAPQPRAEKHKAEELPGPKQIPGLVGKYLMSNFNMHPNLVPILKIVERRRPQTDKALNCRVFDPSEAEASEIQVKNYLSLDSKPDLILYEGWFDEFSKHVELEEKRKITYDVPLFTETEIKQKIEALNENNKSVFFYLARGPSAGGPLGRGAAVIELNPNYPKKGKKYAIFAANVVGTEPVAKRQKSFDSDKPKEIANWVKTAHHQRAY